MKTTFVYRIVDRDPYLVKIDKGSPDALEFHIPDTDNAILRVGDIATKMEDGVGRVKLSDLPEGKFTPEVIFSDKSVWLYPISYSLGIVSVAEVEDICAMLGARALASLGRIDALEGEVAKLNDAVYGKAIF
ncbi:MAG: hypothetical protein J6Q69_03145 [Clostridia bacterium]|nr:hypothetical protein [Clostridia bacterium]